MTDNPEPRQDEINRVKAVADDMAKLVNGRFVLDQTKLQAFAPSRDKDRLDRQKNSD